jgi:hypothetical protein
VPGIDTPALESPVAAELALLQPTPGYMRLVKDRILYVWEQGRAGAKERTAEQEQRLQQLLFPEGLAYDGIRFNRTAVTAPLFSYLAPSDGVEERVVSPEFASWNQIGEWLRRVQARSVTRQEKVQPRARAALAGRARTAPSSRSDQSGSGALPSVTARL